ncbi:MAG: prolyl oligopeptidase family serine peptidase [Planctomycetota bacterium]
MPAFRLSIVLLLLTPVVAMAQPKPGDISFGDAVIESHLTLETARLSERIHEGANSKEEWEAKRGELKRQFFDMLGLWPLPERTPLKAKVTGTVERDAFRVEKVHFQSKPGLYVTGNLYLPKKFEGKLPTVLYVCGHSGKGRDGNKTAFQHHGMWFATHGYACLIIDTLQLGEVAGIHHGTYRENRWWWHSAGYTSAGVECWNGVRAIDYLVSRPEIDPDKIAVTGISGGGAATFWIAAADERVKVAVPVSGMSDLESYVTDKVCNGHCDCMFLYNNYRWEWSTIAALIAPRAMLFENSGYDTIFPMPGNERIRDRLAHLYRWYEKKPGDLFDIGVTPGGHSDNVELRLMAYRWINKHLKGDNAEVSEPPLPKIDGKELRVFPEDADLPKDSLNDKIDETFVALAKPSTPTNKAEYSAWSKSLRDGLSERVFREWPDQVSAASHSGDLTGGPVGGRTLMRTEDDVTVLTKSHVTTQGAKPTDDQLGRIWLVVLNPDDPEGTLPDWTKDIVPLDQTAVVLSPRGCGETLKWTQKNPPNYVERAHVLLGRTVDAGRVRDIRAVSRTLHESDAAERTIAVVGRGRAGILGAYAALNDTSIAQVVVVDPPASHRAGPHFLGVMKILDIPEALGLLAPKHLTLMGAKDAAFERTLAAFKAAGHAGRVQRRD